MARLPLLLLLVWDLDSFKEMLCSSSSGGCSRSLGRLSVVIVDAVEAQSLCWGWQWKGDGNINDVVLRALFLLPPPEPPTTSGE